MSSLNKSEYLNHIKCMHINLDGLWLVNYYIYLGGGIYDIKKTLKPMSGVLNKYLNITE